MINLFNVKISQQAKENVQQVLDSGFLNEGIWVKRFEEKLIEKGFHNPITVNSCTSALHLSLVCLGVGPGDEVILPAQTFIATGTAILQTGAKPVFCDIDPYTGNIDPNKIKEKITNKTKAIIVVHWTGLPCLMDEIYEVAGDIPVIEDAAHAFGATYKSNVIGSKSKSRFICFSFQAIKMFTTGDGGLICVRDQEDYKKIIRLKWFGFDKNTIKRRPEGDRDYLVTELGYKYNMNNITAAIGLGNLDDYDVKLKKHQDNASIYNKEFKNIKNVNTREYVDCEPTHWVYTMLVRNRLEFMKRMKEAEIEVSVLDRGIDINPIFGSNDVEKEQQFFNEHQISIPVHDGLSKEDLDKIIKTVRDY